MTKKPAKKKKKPAKAKKKAAKAKKATTAAAKKKTGGHPLGLVDYLEMLLLVLSPFAAVALLLFGSDFQRKPRAPSRTRRRRTLVITPMSRNH